LYRSRAAQQGERWSCGGASAAASFWSVKATRKTRRSQKNWSVALPEVSGLKTPMGKRKTATAEDSLRKSTSIEREREMLAGNPGDPGALQDPGGDDLNIGQERSAPRLFTAPAAEIPGRGGVVVVPFRGRRMPPAGYRVLERSERETESPEGGGRGPWANFG
ncbi:unnamed protein product, partial [Durusdinium trenchii]